MQEMSKSLGLSLLETSAKDSLNVEKAFEMLVQQIMDKRYISLFAYRHNIRVLILSCFCFVLLFVLF